MRRKDYPARCDCKNALHKTGSGSSYISAHDGRRGVNAAGKLFYRIRDSWYECEGSYFRSFPIRIFGEVPCYSSRGLPRGD